MTGIPTPHEPGCADWQTWCGYVDGSVTGPQRDELAAHLEACDRCFATVTDLRLDLAEVAAEAAVGSAVDPRVDATARRRTRRAAFAAAAVLVLLWIGLWQATSWLDVGDPAQRPGLIDAGSVGGPLGFAGSGDQSGPLQAPVHLQIIFTEFGQAGPPRAVPAWAGRLLETAEAHGTLRGACAGVWSDLTPRGAVLPARLRTRLPATAFTADAPVAARRRYAAEILTRVPADPPAAGDRVVVLVTPEPDVLGAPAEVDAEGLEGLRIIVVAEDEATMVRQMCAYLGSVR